jgi:hypothetical protein
MFLQGNKLLNNNTNVSKKDSQKESDNNAFANYASQCKIKPCPEPKSPLASEVVLGGSLSESQPAIQMKAEEKEPLQGKGNIQLAQGPEEEEPLQGKGNIQLAKDEEEPLQGKGNIQLAKGPEEEEPLQGKGNIQLAAKEKKESSNSTGMPDAVKSKMEGAFSTDFSDVKIHTNSEQSKQLGALAFTQGSDVHFSSGQYNPNTQGGQELLGHELTHVVQQRQGRVSPTKQGKGISINDSPVLENEADVLGKKAALGQTINAQVNNTNTSNIAQFKTPAEKVKEFQSKTYSKNNIVPSTGIGLFNASLNPVNGRLEIKVNVNFNFVDGSAASFAGLKGQSNTWSKEEKLKWKNDFITLIEGRWGGKYHFINDQLPGMTVYTDVEVDEVSKDWHYQLNVTKIPKGGWAGSSISHVMSGGKAKNTNNTHHGALDSGDLTYVNKGAKEKQAGALHEFGHMIGLDDEYADGSPGISHAALAKTALGKVLAEGTSNDIMSCGDTIAPQHYVTFLEALQTITSDKDWKFKP